MYSRDENAEERTVTRKGKIRHKYRSAGFDEIWKNSLRWLGHGFRMDEAESVRLVKELYIERTMGCLDGMESDMKSTGVSEEDTGYRVK